MTAVPAARPRFRYVHPAPDPEPAVAELRHNPDAELDVPDWRYQLGQRIAATRAERLRGGYEPDPLPRTLDPLLGGRVIPFMQRQLEARTPWDRQRLAEREPGLMWATTVNAASPMTRYRLEALFSGGATAADAAGVLGTERNYVWWYEQLFFDISAHLGDPRWLLDRVFARALQAGTVDARYNIVWKIVAGVFGWRTFAAGNDGVVQALTPEVTAGITGMVRGRAAEDAFLAQVTRTINRYNGLAVVEEHHRAEDVELRRLTAAGEDAAGDGVEEFAKTLVPILAAVGTARATLEEAPLLEGPVAEVFVRRDRENAERQRVAAARTAVKELSDDA